MQNRNTSASSRLRRFWCWLPVVLLWPMAVYVWPALRVDDTEAGRNWQATADVTLATIIGTIVVLVLTVGLLALQMLSPYGWRATRMLVTRWFYMAAAVVVIAGVVLPVWVAANPSATWTRVAFLCFGWSILVIAAAGTAVVMMISPQELVDSLVRRTDAVLVPARQRSGSRRSSLRTETEALIEVFGSTALPDSARRQVAGAIRSALTKDPPVDEFEFTDGLNAIIAVADNLSSPAQLMISVDLISHLGIARAESFGATQAAEYMINDVAASARATRRHELAKQALDALNGLWISRLLAVLPINNVRTSGDRSDDVAVTYGMEVLPSQHSYVIDDAVSTLRSRLSAPHPSSDQWPDGWQGMTAFEEDVQRIGRLASYLYKSGRYPGSEAADAILADVAHHLVREGVPAVDLRGDTAVGWWERPEHCHHPSVVVSGLLVDVTTAAFASGFDRQVFLNGCQLLAILVTSMQHNNLLTAKLYSSCLLRAAYDIGIHNHDPSHADRLRGDGVLTALVAESVTVWRAAETTDELRECAQEAVAAITSASLRSDELLAVLAWHARLAAAGWPTERQNRRHALEDTTIRPLPAIVVADARGALLDHISQAPLAATLLMVLWTNAVIAESEPVTDELRKLVDAVRRDRADRFDWGGDDAIGRLSESVASWLDEHAGGADPAVPRIQSAGTPPSLHTLLRKVKENQRGRTYHGVYVDGNYGVLIVESDESTRLLRDHKLCAAGVSSWGYGGRGPSQLAIALTEDCVAEALRCPTCLGSTKVTSGMIECPDCTNSGYLHSLVDIATGLNDTVTSKLPNLPGCAPTRRRTEWSLPLDVLVDHVLHAVIIE